MFVTFADDPKFGIGEADARALARALHRRRDVTATQLALKIQAGWENGTTVVLQETERPVVLEELNRGLAAESDALRRLQVVLTSIAAGDHEGT